MRQRHWSSPPSNINSAVVAAGSTPPPERQPTSNTINTASTASFWLWRGNSNTMTSNNGFVNGAHHGLSHAEAAPLPQFGFREVILGRSVGKGGFSVVQEVTQVELDEIYDVDDADTARRKAFADDVNTARNTKYVLKMLRTDLPEDEHIKGIGDLAIEADFLRVLSHHHIIGMRAVANSDPYESRYFVVLDRLAQTLERKFNYWRKAIGENAGTYIPCYGYCCSNAPALHLIWKERLQVAVHIAEALQYLHAQRIVYRDLKPDNIGFDAQGQLKVFDFGLAKRLDEAEMAGNGLYRLTGNTGSLRYMAPEVALDEPYDASVDVYSFGILFWQICSLTTPYAGYSQRMHADKVVRGGQRPTPDRSWPASWTGLMSECWSAAASQRPTFDYVVGTLADRLEELVADYDGVVPTRTLELIRAKKRKHKLNPDAPRLDVDTRLAAAAVVETELAAAAVPTSPGFKRFDNDIV